MTDGGQDAGHDGGARDADDEATRDALSDALTLVGRREYSEARLRRKLERKGHSREAAEAASRRCVEGGYVDDHRYGKLRAELRLERRPSGRTDIVRDLRGKGLTPTMAERVADEVIAAAGGEDEILRRALEDWCSRHGEPEDWNAAKRCFDHLVRRGFSRGLVRDRLSPWIDSFSD